MIKYNHQPKKKGFQHFSFYLPVLCLVFAQVYNGWNPTMLFKSSASQTSAMALDVSASSNSPLCTGFTLNLAADVVGGGTGPYTYSWSGPAGFTSTAQNPSRPDVISTYDGTYFVTVTEPGSGMTGTASVDVEIIDGPTVNAGVDQFKCVDIIAQLDGSIGGTASSAVWTRSPNVGTFVPNASTLDATFIPPAGFTGPILFTLTTNDPPGSCGAVSDQMTILWDDPGTVVCNDFINVGLDENCEVFVTPDMCLEGDVTDALFIVELFGPNGVPIPNPATGQFLGSTITARVTNTCNGNNCDVFLTLEDDLDPVFLSCEDVYLNCAVPSFTPNYITNTLGIAAGTPDVIDNCSTPTLTYIDTWVDLDCNDVFNGMSDLSGYVRRVWTATDAVGNTSSCTQFIYFERLHVYDVLLPADIDIDCDNPDTSVANTGAPYWQGFGNIFPLNPNNAFCELSVSYEDQLTNLCGGTRAVIRTWTIYDFCLPTSNTPPNMNPLEYVQLINIIDDQGPEIDCPDDLTVNMDALDCCASVDLPDVVVSDNCSAIDHLNVYVETTNPFTGITTSLFNTSANLVDYPFGGLFDTLAIVGTTTCLPPGTHQVYYVAEDHCGNASTCSFDITIQDNVPPVAACDEHTQVSLGSDGMIFVNAETFDDGSYDNCGMVYFKARRVETNNCQPANMFFDQVKFCCEDVGDTIKVIMRVYDVPVPPGGVSLDFEEQHSNECEVEVLVDDKLKPVCIPPANVTVSCENFDPSLWAYGMAQGVDNCCMDTVTTSTNYATFDTACNRGTIVRTFRVIDCQGNSNQCTQRIVVNYEEDFYVKFPNDVIVNECDGAGVYGEPEFYGEDCELLAVSYTDQVFTVVPDACFKIERTWTIINWCSYDPNAGCVYIPNPNPNATLNHPSNLVGPTVSAQGALAPWNPTISKINPNDPQPTNYSSFWDPNVNCYQYKQIIKIIDSEPPVFDNCPDTLNICDLTDNNAQLWHANYWFDPVNVDNDLCEGPSDISITGTDSCSGANVSFRYLLFLDLDSSGDMETVISSANLPPAGSVYFNNANTANFAGGILREFDHRNVSSNQKYRFAIQEFTNGNSKTAAIMWNTPAQPNNYVLPELPYGTHKVKWFMMDGCGNETVCEYTIIVKDCKPPTVVCTNGLTTNMMPTGEVTVNLIDFFQETYDNCTPTDQIGLSISKSGATEFPVDANGDPITELTFDCNELGLQTIELWAIDNCGNADFCTSYVIVQDNAGNCGPGGNVTVAGALLTENIDGVEDTYVELSGFNPSGPGFSLQQMSDVTGDFHFSNAIPLLSDFVLTPSKDDNPLNGVSTYDLVLISQHILGLQPLNSPYSMIAADANNSGSITTIDIVDLRRLILGITTELPNNPSWRFIDKDFVFQDPANPFATAFPESKTVASIQANQMNDDFMAIKIGDVNGSAIPNTMMQADDRFAGTLMFDVEDKEVEAGEEVTVRFHAAEQVRGFQFTMNFPDLIVLDIKPGVGIQHDNFGVFPDEHILTTSYYGNEQTGFEVKFKALAPGKLSDMIAVSSRITKAEAYNMYDERLDVAFRFFEEGKEPALVGVGFELYQNQPNPFYNNTVIGFHLPEASEIVLTIYDDMGQTRYTQRGEFGKGYNTIAIESTELNSTGLLYYKLETPTETLVKTMVRMQ
jgi:hypothetical protein